MRDLIRPATALLFVIWACSCANPAAQRPSDEIRLDAGAECGAATPCSDGTSQADRGSDGPSDSRCDVCPHDADQRPGDGLFPDASGTDLLKDLPLDQRQPADTAGPESGQETTLPDSETADSQPADALPQDQGAPPELADQTEEDTAQPDPCCWVAGTLSDAPSKYDLLPLPGGGTGVPVVTSNNPEIFEGEGFLYQTARKDPVRGGQSYPLSGSFGVYLHHLNKSGKKMYLHILITNPNPDPVVVSGFGSGYNQSDTGGLGFGFGPDYQVAEDWLLQTPDHVMPETSIGSFKAAHGWVHSVNHGSEIDGRFQFTASAGVYVYVIAADSSDINTAVNLTLVAAPGDIHPPGNPPPPFGREAGVYEWDTWQASWELQLPLESGAHWTGYLVNTATGIGLDQVQAFDALTAFDDSAKEAVGMYGNTYALTLELENPSPSPRTIEVYVAALGQGSPSFFFNGPIMVQQSLVPVLLTPQERMQLLDTLLVPGGGSATWSADLFIQGLSSIPQALVLIEPGA